MAKVLPQLVQVPTTFIPGARKCASGHVGRYDLMDRLHFHDGFTPSVLKDLHLPARTGSPHQDLDDFIFNLGMTEPWNIKNTSMPLPQFQCFLGQENIIGTSLLHHIKPKDLQASVIPDHIPVQEFHIRKPHSSIAAENE